MEILEVTPEEFADYQDKISREGLRPISFKHYHLDTVKKETAAAVLLVKDGLICWVPKSCLYSFELKPDGSVSVYIRQDFPLNWMRDNF